MLVIEFQNPIVDAGHIPIVYYDEADKRAGVRRHMEVDFDTLSRLVTLFGQHSAHLVPMPAAAGRYWFLQGQTSHATVDLCGAAVHLPFANIVGNSAQQAQPLLLLEYPGEKSSGMFTNVFV